tara:strand:- start:155 stop:451 length:297 start_codon:yes stop_codon:yes gene_type:complete
MQGLIGGKPNAESKKLMNSLDRSFANDSHKAISLLSRIADAMDRLYQKVRSYQEELHYDNQYEKEHGEQKSYRSAPRYGKEIARYVNYILTNKFGSVY